MPSTPAETPTMSGAALAAAKQALRREMKQRLAALAPVSVAEQSAAIFHALIDFPPYAKAHRVAVFLSMPTSEVQTDAIVRHALAAGKAVFVPYLHRPGGGSGSGPAPVPSRVMDMVQLRDCADYESLATDRWGIPSIDPASVAARTRILGDRFQEAAPEEFPGPSPEPVSITSSAPATASPLRSAATPSPSLDLILVPGVAFDVDPASNRIRRCGHGKGFYDFFFQRCESLGRAPAPLFGLALAEQVLPGPPGASVPMDSHDRLLDGLIIGNGAVVTAETAAAPPEPTS